MNNRHHSSTLAALALTFSATVFAACGGSTDTAPAPTAPSTAAAAAPAAPGATGSFAITPQGSKIEWTGSKVSAHHDGSFASFTGKIDLAGPIEQGKLSVDIDTASLTVAADPALGPMIEKLQGHLKSPDFFDVARFPKATFVSTAIAAGGSGAPYTVSGNLTIHGVTKPISFPAQISVAGNTVTAAATFNVNRRDFGLNYPGQPNNLIKDDVQIRLAVRADKQ